MGDITRLLEEVGDGGDKARDELFARVYQDLRKLARSKLARESPFTNLDTTSLVHDAYLRLTGGTPLKAADRRVFYSYAASVMRSIIIDEARRRASAKRGGGLVEVTLITEMQLATPEEGVDLEALDASLKLLKELDEQCHNIVELRYFGGLTIEEIAELLELSPATIKRKWQKARAFLYRTVRNH